MLVNDAPAEVADAASPDAEPQALWQAYAAAPAANFSRDVIEKCADTLAEPGDVV